MKNTRWIQRRHILGAAAALTLGHGVPAIAQGTFPNRPIKIVIPLPAGGVADANIRAIAIEAEKLLGQSLVVENKPGGLFQIGVQSVLAAPADGYTLFFSYSGMTAVQAVHKRFDLVRQFVPVVATGVSPTVLAVGAKSKFNTVKDLVDYGRANPNKLNYTTVGAGTIEHLKSYEFTKAAGFSATAVPYKGGPDAVNAVIAGDVDFTLTPAFFAAQFAPKGLLKLLAVMDEKRLTTLPDVPTIREAGVDVPPFLHRSILMVKAGTPTAIVQKLNEALSAALLAPSVKEAIASTGSLIPSKLSPQELHKQLQSEVVSMGELAQQLNLKPE